MADVTPSQVQFQDDDGVELDYLGTFQTRVVGIQYYTGRVNRNEMVIFQREPNNQYDRFAIRVDNIHHIKVGHLPRTVVQYLSPLVDSGKFLFEGRVPYGNTNQYQMPVLIDCYGDETDRDTLTRSLTYARCPLSNTYLPTLSPVASPNRATTAAGASTSRVPAAPKAQRLTAKQVAERVNTVFDSLMSEDGPRDQIEPASIIKTPLYAHQKEALAWMIKQENSNQLPVFWEEQDSTGSTSYFHTLTNFTSQTRPEPSRGGLLCDDMGLGKSLVTISLIATNCPGVSAAALRPTSGGDAQDDAGNAVEELAEDAGVVEEVVEEEEEEEERPKKKSRTTKKGQKKQTKQKATKSKASAKTAAAPAAPAAEVAATTSQEQEGDISSYPPRADGPQPTLILCPLSVLAGWEMQFEEHVAAGKIKVLTYHGTDRDRRVAQISKYDVVLSTYGTLVSESGTKNGLNAVKWLRVVADEAHYLKNPATLTSQIVKKLSAERRWGLTGTPIQNSLRDLHGLVSFLNLDPLGDATLFRRSIERPVVNGESGAVEKLQALVGSLALRRTKATQRNGVPLVSLPPKEVYLVPVELDTASRVKYERWESAGRSIIAQHVASGTLMANYTAVLEVILRLRQICCDASLVSSDEPSFASLTAAAAAGGPSAVSRLTAEVTEQLIGLLRDGLTDECPVCLCEIAHPCITLCRHIFCKKCIDTVISKDKAACPLCRGPISHADLVELPPEPEPVEDDTGERDGGDTLKGTAAVQGAKISALLGTLQAALARNSAHKHVVFSQFTGMLDLVGNALRNSGIEFCRLDGKTPQTKRNAMLRAFADESVLDGPRVFLVSLKAGGVGLNLTAACHAHLLDPYWNPAVEEQAADRVHRLGQKHPVSIHRYVVKESIEERMLELQEEKRKLMKAAFERKVADDVRAARVRDVRLLMQLQ